MILILSSVGKIPTHERCTKTQHRPSTTPRIQAWAFHFTTQESDRLATESEQNLTIFIYMKNAKTERPETKTF